MSSLGPACILGVRGSMSSGCCSGVPERGWQCKRECSPRLGVSGGIVQALGGRCEGVRMSPQSSRVSGRASDTSPRLPFHGGDGSCFLCLLGPRDAGPAALLCAGGHRQPSNSVMTCLPGAKPSTTIHILLSLWSPLATSLSQQKGWECPSISIIVSVLLCFISSLF